MAKASPLQVMEVPAIRQGVAVGELGQPAPFNAMEGLVPRARLF
jgi:hypothetical protein